MATNMEDYSLVDPKYREHPFSYTEDAKVAAASFEVGSPFWLGNLYNPWRQMDVQ